MASRESLRSWNHWINDRPLYRNLFQPLWMFKFRCIYMPFLLFYRFLLHIYYVSQCSPYLVIKQIDILEDKRLLLQIVESKTCRYFCAWAIKIIPFTKIILLIWWVYFSWPKYDLSRIGITVQFVLKQPLFPQLLNFALESLLGDFKCSKPWAPSGFPLQ